MNNDEYDTMYKEEQEEYNGEESITQGKETNENEEGLQETISEIQEEIPEEELEDYKPSQISKGIRRPIKSKSLSDKDLFRRTASIFEQAKKITIQLNYKHDNNMVFPKRRNHTDEYVINISSPADKAIPKYTALNHELAHLAFDTFVGGTSKKEFGKKVVDLGGEYVYKDYAEDLYDMCANVLEDERIESKLGDIYLGTAKRFAKATKKIGEGYTYTPPDPCSALLATRMGRLDLVPKEWKDACKEAIEGVRMTDKYGLLITGNKFIDDVLNPWLVDNGIDIPKKPQGPSEGEGDGDNNNSGNNAVQDANAKAKQHNSNCDHRFLGDNNQGEDKGKIDMPSLDESKEEGEKEVDDLRNEIEKNSQHASALSYMPADCGQITHIKRYDAGQPLTYNHQVAKGLNRIFRELQSKNKYKLYESGDTLDIGAVIRKKARGFGEVFRQKRITSDLTILVSIDVSGSMSGEPVAAASKMCATVFKAIQGVKGINFYAFAWNGGWESLDITEIDNMRDCKAINCNGGGGGTPTQEAMAYSVSRLIQMKGRRKVLIFITDGEPSNGAIGRVKVQKWVKEARRRGYVVIGMYPAGYKISGYSRNDFGMENMFGKGNFMIYEDMDKASGEVITMFKNLAMRQVRGH